MTPRAAAPTGFIALLARCFLPFAAAYFLSYLYRSVNAVIGPRLVGELSLDAAGLGLLTSAYFAAFAAFQLPLGILLDRFGPRRVESALLLCAALGGALFAVASDIATLTVGRALIGLGVSSCLMAALKANVQFWPRTRVAFANGCLMAFGGLGAAAATLPVQALLGVIGWRGIFVALVVLTVAAAVYLFSAVPERGGGDRERLIDQARTIVSIYRSPIFWRVVPMTVAAQAAFLAYQGLWAGPWLADVDELSGEAAAEILFIMALCMIPGFFSSGLVYDALQRAKISPLASVGVMVGSFIAVQVALMLGLVPNRTVAWSMFCIAGCWTVITFAYLNQTFPAALTGRVNTAVNLLVFLSAFALQAGVGAIIDLFPGREGHFAPEGHRLAFALTIALQVAGFAWYLLPRRA